MTDSRLRPSSAWPFYALSLMLSVADLELRITKGSYITVRAVWIELEPPLGEHPLAQRLTGTLAYY